MEGRFREDVRELRGWVFSERNPPPIPFEKGRKIVNG